MKIRMANKDDLQVIQDLYWSLDTDAINYSPEHFIRTKRPEDFLNEMIEGEDTDIILLEKESKVFGFALIMVRHVKNISCLKPNAIAYIQDFVIEEAYRSKGYGSELMDACKKWGKDKETNYLRLSVFPENLRGIKFYKKNGLKEQMLTMECEL